MLISMDDIFNFHKIRTQCHINCMNYFASLLGYHFPEHDNDKMKEPMRTGYAYINYAHYHKNFNFSPEYKELFNFACITHHKTNSHHIDNYLNVSEISDIRLIEMVSDWFSAHTEQLLLNVQDKYLTVTDWFNTNMLNNGWAKSQLKTIYQTIDFIEKNADFGYANHLWDEAFKYADL